MATPNTDENTPRCTLYDSVAVKLVTRISKECR